MDKAVMSVRMKKWAGIIQEAATSGLTKTEFCARKGIDRRQFFHWQKQIREYVWRTTLNWGSRLRLMARLQIPEKRDGHSTPAERSFRLKRDRVMERPLDCHYS